MVKKSDTYGARKCFIFKFGVIINAYFDIICTDVVYPPGEKLSLFIHFLSNQRFS